MVDIKYCVIWSKRSLSSGLKLTHSFVKIDQNVYKTANKSASIHSCQIPLSSNRLELSSWSFIHAHVFKKIETTLRGNFISKALHFLQITAEHRDCPVFTVFLTIKTSPQNISLKLYEQRGGYWWKTFPWTNLEGQFPVPRYTAAGK